MSNARTLANLIDGSNIVVPSGYGLDFSANANASGMTSEVLDDYEEGTWTQATAGTNANLSSIVFNTTDYRIIGDTVFAYIGGSFTVTTANSRSFMYATIPINRSGDIFGTIGVRGPFSNYEINVGRVIVGNSSSNCVIEFEPDRISNGDSCDFFGLIIYTA